MVLISGYRNPRLGGHAKSFREDIQPLLITTVFMAVCVNILYVYIKLIFITKHTIEFFFVEENGVPLLVFQTVFLSTLTNVLLPLFFKVYGSVIFGTYKTRIEKGFDQALYKRDEGRLLQNGSGNCRTFYDLYS